MMRIKDFLVEEKKRKLSPHFAFIAYNKKEKKYVNLKSYVDYFGESDTWIEYCDRKHAVVFYTSYPLDCIKCDTRNSRDEAISILQDFDEWENIKLIPVFRLFRYCNYR